MKLFKFTLVLLLLIAGQLFSQEKQVDTVKVNHLKEVIVINKAALKNKNSVRPLASIDEYLEKSGKITMIKRGSYAWELAINNMVSERISVTIDGMQIFGACTDKMDPITSYVDVSNLCEAHVKSGQEGTENGSAIGGGVDLKLQKSNFSNESLNGTIENGYETNGNVKIASADINHSTKKFFLNADAIYRKSENQKAGGNEVIEFSQYEKYNISTVVGLKVSENGAVIGSLIYDEANDIGYPALTMDVSLAKAIIGSVSYVHAFEDSKITNWETKLYLNSITHVMDDTKRPNVPIHMDMPGWSDTFGFFSKLKMNTGKHSFLFNLNGYHNKSLAEMTMYPADPNENSMFMLTWPDVRTTYTGIYGEDEMSLSSFEKVKVSARVGFQNEYIADNFGLNSLQIFYPTMADNQQRIITNLSAQYQYAKSNIQFVGGLGYGERAPSVTEAYGFYLFNSFDNYDYVGNPYLTNEKSIEINSAINYSKSKFSVGLNGAYFHISDYIIGNVNSTFDRMTIGADGVKVYAALDYATIFNGSIMAGYKLSNHLNLNGVLSYNLGKGADDNNLPLISPVTFQFELNYKKELFDASIGMLSAGKQRNFSATYGEDETPAYTIFNCSASYNFIMGSNSLFVKAGVENIFDTYYSTFADWKNIPRTGRNIYLSLSYILK